MASTSDLDTSVNREDNINENQESIELSGSEKKMYGSDTDVNSSSDEIIVKGANKSRKRGTRKIAEIVEGQGELTERERLKYQYQFKLLEIQEREKERELALQEREAQERERELEMLERERDREFQLKKLELEIARDRNKEPERATGKVNEGLEMANYVKLLEKSFPTTPRSQAEILTFFDDLERLFEIYDVPQKFHAKLILTFFDTTSVNHLFRRLTNEQCKDYEVVKTAILAEFHFTPDIYLKQFNNITKGKNESYVQLASRLMKYFTYYLQSSEVETFDQLVALNVTDKFKTLLPTELRTYLLQRGVTSKLDTASKLSKLCDEYQSQTETIFDAKESRKIKFDYSKVPRNDKQNFGSSNRGFTANFGTNEVGNRHVNVNREFNTERKIGSQFSATHRDSTVNKSGSYSDVVCFLCKQRGHVKKFCGLRKTVRDGNKSDYHRVNRVEQVVEDRVNGSDNRAQLMKNISESHKGPRQINRVSKNTDEIKWEATVNSAGQRTKQDVNVVSLPMSRKVKLVSGKNKVEALVDSGAEFSCIRAGTADESLEEKKGQILLRAFDGSEGYYPVKQLGMRLTKDDEVKTQGDAMVNILCAVVPNLSEDLLLSVEDYERLRENYEATPRWKRINEVKFSEITETVNENSGIFSENQESHEVTADTVVEEPTEVEVEVPSDALIFREQQLTDNSLRSAREDGRRGKNNYVYLDRLLYHRDKILGETVMQLVVPQCRRGKVLEIAHNSVFGGHMGFRKTLERIRYSFYWPGIKANVRKYCDECTECQLRRPASVKDRVPITPVRRPDFPFQVVNVDIIGPIDPPSSKGHRYVLVLMDQHSRWPEAACLTSLSARSTCEALLEIFQRTGIPEVIATDQGTNFTSALTQEMITRLGSSPRFSTPGHPASNGLVERFNRVLKNMLHHTIREESRNWHKAIPFLLWAYREVPNASTNMAPFQLLYGRKPNGPLSILQKTWAGECSLPPGVNRSAAQYLQQLKERMELAARQVKEIAEEQQDRYAAYSNRRSRHKDFEVGDQVIALIPDSQNKLYARWTGPATVKERRGPHGYVIEAGKGFRRYVHVNKLRKFKSSVNVVGVVFQEDQDFGKIVEVPKVVRESEYCHQKMLNTEEERLDSLQIQQLRDLISEFGSFFSEKVGHTNVGEHKIRVRPGSILKTKHRYTIPQSMRKAVDQQIEELLENDMIEESYAEFTHPVVCVAKKDSSVRMCVDYRMLNAFTELEAYPMAHVPDLLARVGAAHYISTLDMLRGYYQIPLEESSRVYTSFATHRSQYQFKVMPFGLQGSAATYQRIMNRILSPHLDYSVAYLDDVAIFSTTWEEHLEHLGKVLESLTQAGLTGNLGKCCFAKRRVKYLGHLVGSGTHQPDPDKLKAIRDIAPPKTKKEVRSFLGLVGYFLDYVPDFAKIAKPLSDLTSKKAKDAVVWDETLNKSFEELKRRLITTPVLNTPNFSKPFIMFTDASNVAVAVCLVQSDDAGNVKPVAYASKKLNDTQRRWATCHQEAYAIIFGLQKFENWIFGVTVEVRSDHNPLAFLTNSASQSSKLQRWLLAISQYDVKVKHISGKDIPHVDALSRLTVVER